MEENTIELPQEIFSKGSGTFEGENYKLTIRGEIGYLWTTSFRPIPTNQDYRINFHIPGSLPVVCSASEMIQRNLELIIDDQAVIELKSVQRREGYVRVVVRRSARLDTSFLIGIGVVFAIE